MKCVDKIRKIESQAKVGGIIGILGSLCPIGIGIVFLIMWTRSDPKQIMFANELVYLFICGVLLVLSGLGVLLHSIGELRNHSNRAILELAEELERLKNAGDK